jgi:GlpG protein
VTGLQWYPVVRFPLQKNLMPLLNYLQAQDLLFHVTEEEGEQQLWISDEPRVLEVAEYCAQWASGELNLDGLENKKASQTEIKVKPAIVLLHLVRILPVTMLVILGGIIGTIAVYLAPMTLEYAEPLLFQAINRGQFTPVEISMAEGQYWRLFTPMFLHFGFLHLLFNALFIWVIGRRIELVKGSLHFFVVVFICALIANVAQYLQQANTVFGGLSGVVYAVIGYVGVYQRLVQHPILQFNEAAIVFFIVWLMLGVFGIIDWFIPGSIANGAHVAGLVSGALIGGIIALTDKAKNKS